MPSQPRSEVLKIKNGSEYRRIEVDADPKQYCELRHLAGDPVTLKDTSRNEVATLEGGDTYRVTQPLRLTSRGTARIRKTVWD